MEYLKETMFTTDKGLSIGGFCGMVFDILPVLQCLVPLEMYKSEHIDLKNRHCLHVNYCQSPTVHHREKSLKCREKVEFQFYSRVGDIAALPSQKLQISRPKEAVN